MFFNKRHEFRAKKLCIVKKDVNLQRYWHILLL